MDNKAWAQEVAKKIKEKEIEVIKEKCKQGSLYRKEWCV